MLHEPGSGCIEAGSLFFLNTRHPPFAVDIVKRFNRLLRVVYSQQSAEIIRRSGFGLKALFLEYLSQPLCVVLFSARLLTQDDIEFPRRGHVPLDIIQILNVLLTQSLDSRVVLLLNPF